MLELPFEMFLCRSDCHIHVAMRHVCCSPNQPALSLPIAQLAVAEDCVDNLLGIGRREKVDEILAVSSWLSSQVILRNYSGKEKFTHIPNKSSSHDRQD